MGHGQHEVGNGVSGAGTGKVAGGGGHRRVACRVRQHGGDLQEPVRAAMAAASRGFGRPGAADAVATLVLALAERRPLPSPEAIEAIARGGGG